MADSDLISAAAQAVGFANRGLSWTLRQLVLKTAEHLDVPPSAVDVRFGTRKNEWGWRATLRRPGAKSLYIGPVADDPVRALGLMADHCPPQKAGA